MAGGGSTGSKNTGFLLSYWFMMIEVYKKSRDFWVEKRGVLDVKQFYI